MPTIRQRLQQAISVWRGRGKPDEFSRGIVYPESKGNPYIWPDYQKGRPAYRITDIDAYIEHGFGQNALIYSAVMYKAKSLSSVAMRAYRGTQDKPEPLPENHPLSQLVARPNASQSWREFSMAQEIFLNITGDAFTLLDRENSERGVPSAMYALNPAKVHIIPGGKQKSGKPGVIGYLYSPTNNPADDLPILASDMSHVKFPNPLDELDGEGYGLPPVSAMARSADVDNQITEFLQRFFELGAVLPGVISFDTPLTPDVVNTIRERWEEKYGGSYNWHKVGVLDRGGTYQRIALPFNEMGFEALDERNESRILSVFGVPPILIGSRLGLIRSTYSNYEQAYNAFWHDTMLHEIRLFEDDFEYYLQSDDGGFVAYDLSEVPAFQEDISSKVDSFVKLVSTGIPKAQAAKLVGIPIGELPDADTVYMPLSLVPVGGKPQAVPQLTASTSTPEATADDRQTAALEGLAMEIKAARELLEREEG